MEKSKFVIIRREKCGKSVKYMHWVKKDVFGCSKKRRYVNKDNVTGLKEGGGIKILTTVLSIRDARSFALYFTILFLPFKHSIFQV